jgi:hypothetical protein
MTYSDEMLMAYVDRELDSATSASIDAAIARDPELAARVERQRRLARAVHSAYEPILLEPMPKRLLDAATGAAPAAATSRAPRRRTWTWFEWSAMAASIVLGVAIGAAFIGDARRGSVDPGQDVVAESGQLLARGALARALSEQLASTQKPDAPVRIGMTFVSKDGEYCRTFALSQSSASGLACATSGEWRVQVLTRAANQPSEYRMAAGEIPPALLQAMEERIQGSSLDAAAERAAQQSGWRR